MCVGLGAVSPSWSPSSVGAQWRQTSRSVWPVAVRMSVPTWWTCFLGKRFSRLRRRPSRNFSASASISSGESSVLTDEMDARGESLGQEYAFGGSRLHTRVKDAPSWWRGAKGISKEWDWELFCISTSIYRCFLSFTSALDTGRWPWISQTDSSCMHPHGGISKT